MNNIKKFDETVAVLFSILYQEFPKKMTINAFEHLGIELEPIELWDDKHEPEEQSEKRNQNLSEADFFLDTASWLIKSGFIYGEIKKSFSTLDAMPTYEAIDLVLTTKGLELLKLVPDSISSSESLGDKLVSTIGEGARAAGGELVSNAITRLSSISELIASLSNG